MGRLPHLVKFRSTRIGVPLGWIEKQGVARWRHWFDAIKMSHGALCSLRQRLKCDDLACQVGCFFAAHSAADQGNTTRHRKSRSAVATEQAHNLAAGQWSRSANHKNSLPRVVTSLLKTRRFGVGFIAARPPIPEGQSVPRPLRLGT